MASEACAMHLSNQDSVSFLCREAKMEFVYGRNNHSVGDSMWHFEWCPKYRYKIFRKLEYKNLVTACIRKSATENDIDIIELNVMPDHLHMIVKIPLTMTPSKALQFLKGRSAYLFFRNHERARLRYPRGHLWSRGKFASSVGYSDLSTTINYIQTQSQHHGLEAC